jgi:DNA recombination protein RmuC
MDQTTLAAAAAILIAAATLAFVLGLLAGRRGTAALERERAELDRAHAGEAVLGAQRQMRLDALDHELSAARAALAHEALSAGTLRQHLATLEETLRQERRQSADKLALLQDARAQMTGEFRLLADAVMKQHAETFSRQNQEQIDLTLRPLRERLEAFQKGLADAHTDSTRERATLAEQIRALSETGAHMTTETQNLTRALKGRAQVQGAWGEMILQSILDRSGLRAGEHFVLQSSHAGADGQRLRPDVIVNLPDQRRVVIDAKVSLTAFEEHVNADDEPARDAALLRHVASMKAHIRTLGSKEYHTAIGSGLDYVLMFVPIEGALAAALTAESGLTGFAAANNVAIATPTTLMVVLRTVENVWRLESRNRNADQIAARAGALYDKLVAFVDDMQTIGKRLDQAAAAHTQAMARLSTGQGNLLRQAEWLREKGATASKSLPAELLEEGQGAALDPLGAGAPRPA